MEGTRILLDESEMPRQCGTTSPRIYFKAS